MKKVLVLTGASGFIGSHVFRQMTTDENWEIIPVDQSHGFDLAVPGWTKALPVRDVDVIIHLAQSRHYRDFPQQAQDIYQVNVASTFELLQWAREHKARRFIFASTGTVYSPSSGILSESSPCSPSSMYAASKLSAEYLMQPFGEFFEIVIARLFGVYGPGQRHMLIADMIDRVRQGTEILLAAGVGIYLTPLFIDDCVKILGVLAHIPLRQRSVLLNVAGDETLPLAGIVDTIAMRVNKKPLIVHTDDRPRYFLADNSLLKTYYKHPLLPFSHGIALTINNI